LDKEFAETKRLANEGKSVKRVEKVMKKYLKIDKLLEK
jgi:hypothetical protein